MAQIIWTEPALQDLDAVADYIALDKPLAASNFVKNIFKKVDLLVKYPLLGSRPRDLKKLPYRQLIVSPCRIIYRIEGKIVYIVATLRGERKPSRSFFTRREKII